MAKSRKAKPSKAIKQATARAKNDVQASLPASVIAGEFVAEEVAKELRKPNSRKPLKALIEAGLKKAKQSGISVRDWEFELSSYALKKRAA